jgi:hypothetical protein
VLFLAEQSVSRKFGKRLKEHSDNYRERGIVIKPDVRFADFQALTELRSLLVDR